MCFLHWLNSISGLILAILTLIYVVATICLVYISQWSSRNSANQIANIEIKKQRPVVIITNIDVQMGTQAPAQKYVIMNVGSGPALNVFLSDIESTFEGIRKNDRYKYEDRFMNIEGGIVGVNQSIRIFPETGTHPEVGDINLNMWNCRIDYEDLFGNQFTTIYENGEAKYSIPKKY